MEISRWWRIYKGLMKSINLLSGYLFFVAAISTGIAANGYLKTTQEFTKINTTIFCVTSIIICMFSLSKAMSAIPVGFTCATYGPLTITAVTLFGVLKYNQTPNIYGSAGILLIIIGVILLNTLGKLK